MTALPQRPPTPAVRFGNSIGRTLLNSGTILAGVFLVGTPIVLEIAPEGSGTTFVLRFSSIVLAGAAVMIAAVWFVMPAPFSIDADGAAIRARRTTLAAEDLIRMRGYRSRTAGTVLEFSTAQKQNAIRWWITSDFASSGSRAHWASARALIERSAIAGLDVLDASSSPPLLVRSLDRRALLELTDAQLSWLVAPDATHAGSPLEIALTTR